MSKYVFRVGMVFTCCVIVAAIAQAQSVVATGLKMPTKLTLSDDGHLLVTESGEGPNTGGVSRVSRCGGKLRLLDGLPAGFEPRGASSGPSGIERDGRTLYIAIGAGDGTLPGQVPPTEIPNPNPSSPLLSSVLAIEFSIDIDELSSGFVLRRSDHDLIKAGTPVTLVNGQSATATVRLLVDFPNFTDDPILIARASNPFALALGGGRLFLADASQNAIVRIDLPSGNATRVVTLPAIQNPLPFGPPRIDPVPDGIRFYGGRLLVTILTGFPFPAGRAQVLSVDPSTGVFETAIGGLSNAIDVFPFRARNGADEFLTLEYTLNMLAPNIPGRLQHFSSLTATPVLISDTLLTSTGMVRDPLSGDIFVTQHSPGSIAQILGDSDDGFNVCLEDDASGDVLRFNTLTGDYLFVSCRLSTQFRGVGQIQRSACRINLRSARVTATLEACSGSTRRRGSASVGVTTAGPFVSINDSNTANNQCTGH